MGDERRREPGSEPDWCEAFSFEFFDADGVGGFLTLVLLPNRGRSWLWACGTVGGEPVTVVDNDLPVPAGLALHGDQVAAELRCERPLQRWAATLESEALALDLRFDTAGPVDVPPFTAYAFPCRVRGRLRVGDRRLDVDAFGGRGHMWGEVDWSNLGARVHGRFDDGERLSIGGPTVAELDASALEPVATTVVPATGAEGSAVRIRRELCRVRMADGRSGWGWLAAPDRRP